MAFLITTSRRQKKFFGIFAIAHEDENLSLTGIHRDTIMRLGVRVGNGCATLHDGLMRRLNVGRIELDEAWLFVAKKQRHLNRNPPDTASFAADIASLTGFGNGKSSLPRAKSDRDLPLRHCTAEAQSICPHGGVPLP